MWYIFRGDSSGYYAFSLLYLIRELEKSINKRTLPFEFSVFDLMTLKELQAQLHACIGNHDDAQFLDEFKKCVQETE